MATTGKVLIIGGGLAGVVTAKLLESHFDDITLVEQWSTLGGLCHTQHINGTPIDTFGGHVYNSQNNRVNHFVFSSLAEENWKKTKSKGI